MFKASEASTGSGGASKILKPGTHLCRIVDIFIETPPYDSTHRQVMLKLEGIDQGDDFDGLEIDKDKPELGKYRGMVATVKNDLYDISDFEWKGEQISKEQQIYNWVNNLARKMGVLHQMNADNVSGETIEEYVQNVKKYLVNPDLWGYFTIGGKEYYKEGYDLPNYRLFLVSKSVLDKEDRAAYKGKFPFIVADEEKSVADLTSDPQFINFDEGRHVIKAAKPEAPEGVENFGGQEELPTGGGAGGNDLELPMS